MSLALPRARGFGIEVAAVLVAIAAGLLFVVLPRDLIFAGALFAVTAALAAWRPSYAIGALVLTIPIQTSVTLHLGARQLTFTKLVLAAVIAGWFVSMIRNGEGPKLTAVSFTFIFYVCALIASIWNAVNQAAWTGEVYRWFTAGLIYVIAVSAVRKRRDVLAILTASSIAVVACAVVAVMQVSRHSGPPSFTINGVTRAFGAFGEPNPFAAYFEIAALPLVGIAATLLLSRDRRRHIPAISIASIAGTAGMLGVYLTHSRGGAIGTAAGLLAIGLVVDRRVRVAILGLAGVVALGLTFAGTTDRVVARFDSLAHGWNNPIQVTSANFSVEERVAHWGAAVRMWEDHPVIGVGAGNFSDNFRVYTPEWRFRISRGHAHNGYLQSAAQAGTVGLVAYLSILIAALWRAGRALKRSSDSFGRAVAAGAIGATVAVMVHGIFDYLHVLNLGLQLSVVWASVECVRLSRDDANLKGTNRD